MTNGMNETFDEGSVDELNFWEISSNGEALILREDSGAPVYDLEERTSRFGERVILFAKKISFTQPHLAQHANMSSIRHLSFVILP
jgi:hypothetical protein